MKIDAMGHIIVDDSMSEELKEKIKAYNALADSGEGEAVEADISDAEAEAYTEDSIDTGELENEPTVDTMNAGQEIAAEEINDLNSMFE